jgi:cytoskeletal protein CcmA (bactofilin family)
MAVDASAALAQELIEAVGTGAPVRRGTDDEDVAAGAAWDLDRQLPAERLYEVLVARAEELRPRAVVLIGLRITGAVNFEAARLTAPLIAHRCHFDGPLNLLGALASDIQLTRCHVPGVLAVQLETRGSVNLSGSVLGQLILSGARIGGNLDLSDATIAREGFGPAVPSSGVRLSESTERREASNSILSEGMQVDGDVLFGSLRAQGDIRLRSSRIRGALYCGAATFGGKLRADGVEVNGGVFCDDEFHAEGLIRLHGAHVVGPLSFEGATLAQGIRADGMHVDGSAFFRRGFRSEGIVRLAGASITGQLSFNGATLAKGLQADQLRVSSSLLLGDGFRSHGPVRLVGAHIDGQVALAPATLTHDEIALDLEGSRIRDELFLGFLEPPKGRIDLTSTQVRWLVDRESTWPAGLHIDGFTYHGVRASEDLVAAPTARGRLAPALQLRSPTTDAVKRRLRWIALAERTSGYSPQPYTQLVAFLRRQGRDAGARRVAYERERRHSGQLGLRGRLWNAFLRWTVGYGYKPLRAVALLGALVLVGALVFSSFHSDGDVKPLKADHPQFVASIYTLDRLIPVVSFGLRDAFAPRDAAQWWAFAYTLLGWVLTLAVLAGVNAAVRRE